MIKEDDNIEFKNIIYHLNKIGIDYPSLAIDTASIIQFLKHKQSLLLLTNLDSKDLKEKLNLSDFLNKLPSSISYATTHHEKKLPPKELLIDKANNLISNAKEIVYNQKEVKGAAIFVKIGKVFKKILLADIDYIFYEGRHANLKIGEKNIPVKMSMKEFAQCLPDNQFIQIHQAHIINLSKISQINLSNNKVEVQGKWLPIGIKFFKNFKTSISIFY